MSLSPAGGCSEPWGTEGPSSPPGRPWLPFPLELEAVLLLPSKRDKRSHREVKKYELEDNFYLLLQYSFKKCRLQIKRRVYYFNSTR